MEVIKEIYRMEKTQISHYRIGSITGELTLWTLIDRFRYFEDGLYLSKV